MGGDFVCKYGAEAHQTAPTAKANTKAIAATSNAVSSVVNLLIIEIPHPAAYNAGWQRSRQCDHESPGDC
jgi:hypothetical protein